MNNIEEISHVVALHIRSHKLLKFLGFHVVSEPKLYQYQKYSTMSNIQILQSIIIFLSPKTIFGGRSVYHALQAEH
jgi:hypothetical protein